MSSAKTYKTKWYLKPDERTIRKITEPHFYRVGMSHYRDGDIFAINITGDRLHAVVRDQYSHGAITYTKNNMHFVDIRQTESFLDCHCTCDMTFLPTNACMHIVAALLYLKDNFDDLLDEEATRLDKARYLISRVPPKKVMEFLARQMFIDTSILDEFINEFHLEDVHPPRDYAAQVDRMYSRAKQGHNNDEQLDFGDLFAEARDRQDNGEAAEATKMYRDMSKSILDHMEEIIDKNGYYADCCIEALENLVESIIREDPSHKDKQGHIEYLLEGALAQTNTSLVPHYHDALESVCTSPEDLAFWDSLLVRHLDDLDRQSKNRTNLFGIPIGGSRNDPAKMKATLARIIRMQAYILDSTDRHDQSVSLLEEHAPADKDTCIAYLKAIKGMNPRTTIRRAQDAMRAFPGDVQVMDVACHLLPKGGAEHANVLQALFVATENWEYLYQLKAISGDWESVMGGIAADLARSSPERAIEACLKESMRNKAMELLESAGGVGEFEKFHVKLAKKYPERYRTAYGAALEKFVMSRSGKDHYERVAEHLAKIRAISGDECEDLAKRIRKQNPGKRLLAKMLGNV